MAIPTVMLLIRSAVSLAFPMTPRSNEFTDDGEQGQDGWMRREESA
jgi:hypothetical protein